MTGIKKLFILIPFLGACLIPWACNRPYPLTPTPLATPTASPTVNLTPVCGTPTTVSSLLGSLSMSSPGVYVIQNATEWNNFLNPPGKFSFVTPVPTDTPAPGATPTPTPVVTTPVNFADQMLILTTVAQVCNNTTLTLSSVCEGPTQVTVNVGSSTCTSCPACFTVSAYTVVTNAVAVPQSSLPVSVAYTYSTY